VEVGLSTKKIRVSLDKTEVEQMLCNLKETSKKEQKGSLIGTSKIGGSKERWMIL